MHKYGADILTPYAVVMTSSHPEYYSTAMLDAIEAYQARGGRHMYMGGNGFYWRVAFHPENIDRMELRRGVTGTRTWESDPGETGLIRVDPVREVIDRAGYRPFEGRRRAVIIDHAETMMPQAQNALLKTLEEPPSSSVFMLVTARPDLLLPTVQSRCPKLRFWPLSTDEVAAALVRQGRPEADARAVAATSSGSVGQALDASVGDLAEIRGIAATGLSSPPVSRPASGRR